MEEGCLVAEGPRSHLFYEGTVGNHCFRNFEFEAEVHTERFSNSGIYIHTQYQKSGWPDQGYEIQINNTHRGSANYQELKLLFETHLPADAALFNEFHALLVEVGKKHCKPKPDCEGCPLRDIDRTAATWVGSAG